MLRVLLFGLSLSVQFGIYYYLWRRLIRDTKVPAPWSRRLTVMLTCAALSVPLTIASRKISVVIGQTMGWPVFLWLAISGLTAVTLLAVDGAHLMAWLSGRFRKPAAAAKPVDPSRRAFIRRVGGGGALLSASTLSLTGMYEALKTPPLVDVPITLDRLPSAMDGFVIAQITDLHVGNTVGEGFVRSVVNRVNENRPDLIALTGDLVDGSVTDLREMIAPLADLDAPHGVFYVTGNHEYYAGADEWIEHMRELGIRVLRNERVIIGTGDESFDLAGIDDHGSARWPGHGPDLAKATEGRDPTRELILLAHQPRQVHEAKNFGVGLQLSGHTHGGQIWPWHYIVKTQQGGLLAGHSWHGKTQLNVCRGAGYWGPPVRVFAKAEISRYILHSA